MRWRWRDTRLWVMMTSKKIFFFFFFFFFFLILFLLFWRQTTPLTRACANCSGGDYLKSMVYGAMDGLITTFAVVSAVVGGELKIGTVLIMGFANMLADGVSMGFGDYLSSTGVYYLFSLSLTPLDSFLFSFHSFNCYFFLDFGCCL